jgi:hypothetical protein
MWLTKEIPEGIDTSMGKSIKSNFRLKGRLVAIIKLEIVVSEGYSDSIWLCI